MNRSRLSAKALLLGWACLSLRPEPGFAWEAASQQPLEVGSQQRPEPTRPGRSRVPQAALARGNAWEPAASAQPVTIESEAEPEEQPSPAPEETPSKEEAPASPGKAEAEPEDEFAGFEEEFAGPKEGGAEKKVFDPLRGYNRFMFGFNDKFFLWVWKPTAKGYSKVVPESARVAVDRAFHNFRFPQRFVNSLLQLKFKRTGTELGRFLVNSTAGIAGLFDPAKKYLGWRRPPDEDFGQTLGRYGAGPGFPVVLPFLGPSNLRDGLGMIPDIFSHPVVYFVSPLESTSITAGEYFNHSSLRLEEYENLKKDALDPYTFFRDAHQQNREKKIKE